VPTVHPTYPSRFPLFALDRIYCRPANLLKTSHTFSAARLASDHLPVVADIGLAGNGIRVD
jgi:endonuclease/exonuclease/phosphatase family metal-dependent hydrolase